MATLFNRIKNVFDDHQERESTQNVKSAEQRGVQKATESIRDAVLTSALKVKGDWVIDLVAKPEAKAEINNGYRTTYESLNSTLLFVRDVNPQIRTNLNISDFEQRATQEATKASARSEQDLGKATGNRMMQNIPGKAVPVLELPRIADSQNQNRLIWAGMREQPTVADKLREPTASEQQKHSGQFRALAESYLAHMKGAFTSNSNSESEQNTAKIRI